MLPFKKILCPTDFSESSYAALDAGKELADQFSSELLVVHVVDPIPIVPSPEFNVVLYQEQLLSSAEDSLQRICRERLGESEQVRQIVLQGHAADEIVRLASKEAVDVIVIATHGRTGFQHLVFGSVAEKVVRTVSCPVLTIRSNKENEGEKQ